MPVYNRDSRLSDIVIHDPSVIQVINRFGVYLGVGDLTIRECCRIHEIDPSLFLSVINIYLNPDYIPEYLKETISYSRLQDYLNKTDSYYVEVLLPNIERHFSHLISKDVKREGENNLPLFYNFFLEIKEEMTFGYNWDHPQLEEKISDLVSMFVKHLKGNSDPNLCVGVVTALWTLAKDIRQNNRIRERLLKPLCPE